MMHSTLKFTSLILALGFSFMFMTSMDAHAVAAKSDHQKQLVVMVSHVLKPGKDGSSVSDYDSYLDAAMLPVTFRSSVGGALAPDGSKVQRKFEYMMQEFGGIRISHDKVVQYFGDANGKVTPAPFAFRNLFNELNFWMVAEDMEYLNYMNQQSANSIGDQSNDYSPTNNCMSQDMWGSCNPPNTATTVNKNSDLCNYGGQSSACYKDASGNVVKMSDVARYVRMTGTPSGSSSGFAFGDLLSLFWGNQGYDCANPDEIVSPAIESSSAAQKAFGFYLNHMQGAYLLKKNVQAFMQKYNVPTAWIDVEQEVMIHTSSTGTDGKIIRVAGSFNLNRSDIITSARYNGLNGFVNGVPNGPHPWPNAVCHAESNRNFGTGAVLDNPRDGQFLGALSIGQAVAAPPPPPNAIAGPGVGGGGGVTSNNTAIAIKPLLGNNLIEVVYIQGLSGEYPDFLTDYAGADGVSPGVNFNVIDATPIGVLPPWMARLNQAPSSILATPIKASTPTALFSEKSIRGKLWVTVYARDDLGNITGLMDVATVSAAMGGAVHSNPFFLTLGNTYDEPMPTLKLNADGTLATQLSGEIPRVNPSLLNLDFLDRSFGGECLLTKKYDTGCRNQGSAADVQTLMNATNSSEAFVTYVSRWELIPSLSQVAFQDPTANGGDSGHEGPLGVSVLMGDRNTEHNLCQRPVYQNTAYVRYNALRRPVFHWHVTGETAIPGEYATNLGSGPVQAQKVTASDMALDGVPQFNVNNPFVSGALTFAGKTLTFKNSDHQWYGVRGLPRLVPYNKSFDFKRWGYLEKGAMGYGDPAAISPSDQTGLISGDGFNLYTNPLRNSAGMEKLGVGSNGSMAVLLITPLVEGRIAGLDEGWISYRKMDPATKRLASDPTIGSDQVDSLFVDGRNTIMPGFFADTNSGMYAGGAFGDVEYHTYVPDMRPEHKTPDIMHSKNPNDERRQDVFGCGDMNIGCTKVNETPLSSSVILSTIPTDVLNPKVDDACPLSAGDYDTPREECVGMNSPYQWQATEYCEGANALPGGAASTLDGYLAPGATEHLGSFFAGKNVSNGAADHLQVMPSGGAIKAINVSSSTCPGSTHAGTLDPSGFTGGSESCLSFHRVQGPYVARSLNWPGVFMTGDGNKVGAVSNFDQLQGNDHVFPHSNAKIGDTSENSDEHIRNAAGESLYECNAYVYGLQATWTFVPNPGRQCTISGGAYAVDGTSPHCETPGVPVTSVDANGNKTTFTPCLKPYNWCNTVQAAPPSCETKVSAPIDDTNHYGHLNGTFSALDHHGYEESTKNGAVPTATNSNGEYYAVKLPYAPGRQKDIEAYDECEESCGITGNTSAMHVCSDTPASHGSCGKRPGIWVNGSDVIGSDLSLYKSNPNYVPSISAFTVAPSPEQKPLQ